MNMKFMSMKEDSTNVFFFLIIITQFKRETLLSPPPHQITDTFWPLVLQCFMFCSGPFNYAFVLPIKKVKKSRRQHSHKPQPTPDIKRKRKQTESNVCKINKQMHENKKYQLPLSPTEMTRMLNSTEKHENKKVRLNIKSLIVKTTKLHKLRLPSGPRLSVA